LDALALAGLVGLLFLKEAGLPIPVPGDLVVIGAGIAASTLGAAGLLELVAILLAGYAGGSLQFAFMRGALRQRFLRLLARVGVPQARLDSLAGWLQRRGGTGVAMARATPGVRIGAIAASGIAGLGYRGAFLPGLVLGNGLFVGAHFALGFVLGQPALALLASVGSIALVAAGALVVISLVGALAWRLYRRPSQSRAPAALDVLPGFASWTEAACPACQAVTFVGGGADSARR
jgi:membrane protein DedA with SNARE-associated domain